MIINHPGIQPFSWPCLSQSIGSSPPHTPLLLKSLYKQTGAETHHIANNRHQTITRQTQRIIENRCLEPRRTRTMPLSAAIQAGTKPWLYEIPPCKNISPFFIAHGRHLSPIYRPRLCFITHLSPFSRNINQIHVYTLDPFYFLQGPRPLAPQVSEDIDLQM